MNSNNKIDSNNERNREFYLMLIGQNNNNKL